MAINRANQNWPDETAVSVKVLNPYEHTCYQPEGAGHNPNDCPACMYVDLMAAQKVVDQQESVAEMERRTR